MSEVLNSLPQIRYLTAQDALMVKPYSGFEPGGDVDSAVLMGA